MKMKKNILVIAILASISTPTKPMDPLTIAALATGVAVVSVIYAYTPYTCTKCHLFINNASNCVVNHECGRHTFHTYCYDSRVRCVGCVAEEREHAIREQVRRDEAIKEDERQRIAREQARNREVQQSRKDEDACQAREHQARLQEKARKAQQAWQSKQDEKEAQRIAQEESRNARGGYVTSDQAKRDQEEEHGHRKAIEVAKEETRALRERQAFDREQATIQSTSWMMEECSICLAPRAQKNDVLVNLKDQRYKAHTTSLPCGHVFHTACIKEAAQHDNRCPVCRTEFKVRDL